MVPKKGRKTKKKNKLNISHIHWGFPPVIGGVETHLDIILPAMSRAGHNVSILTGSFEGYKGYYKYKGIDIYRAPIMELNWLSQRGINGLEKEIRQNFRMFMDRTHPDVLHVHNMHYFSKPHTRILEEMANRRKIPLILTAHNVWDDNLFLDLTRNYKWEKIIAVSHFIKRELIGIGVDDRKIAVIHHGIDEKLYKPNVRISSILRKYPILKNRSRVIFHPARMGLAKGCDVSIKALRLVREKHPDVLLILAGTRNIIDWASTQQKDIAYMVNLIEYFNLRDNVLIDAFRLEDMPALYSMSNVCLYPSTSSEPFGLTMLEAMAAGKPMVVTDAGGMPEIIKDGINGFVIPIKNFEMLASRILQLLDDDRLNRRFGYTGREIVEQYYTSDIVTRNILMLYDKVL